MRLIQRILLLRLYLITCKNVVAGCFPQSVRRMKRTDGILVLLTCTLEAMPTQTNFMSYMNNSGQKKYRTWGLWGCAGLERLNNSPSQKHNCKK